MKLETLVVHGGYAPDPTTKAVAVPSTRPPPTPSTTRSTARTCSTSRWRQHLHTHHEPTTDVLEKRVAALEAASARWRSPRAAAITYALQTITEAGQKRDQLVGAVRRHLQPVRSHVPQYG